jgi:uncharacterized protein (DUF58 family)
MGALAALRNKITPPRRRAPGRTLAPEELLRRVRRIAIAARKKSASHTSGDYRAVFHGRGMEFSEVREYRPGDDVRSIDWNVTARAGAPYVKIFREERDITLLLLLDLSASQDFGSGLATKRDLVAESAAAIALAAVRNRDRVGAVVFTDRVEWIHRPSRSRTQALRIVRDAVSRPLVGFGTDLAVGLSAARNILKSRAIVVLLSDFRACGYERALGRLSRKHDVIAVATSDPAEEQFPASGLFRCRDAENGRVRLEDTSSRGFRSQWAEAGRHGAEAVCKRSGVDLLRLSSSRAPAEEIAAFFHRRSRTSR